MSTQKHIYILHGWAYSTEKWLPFVKILNKSFKTTLLSIPGLTAPLEQTWNLDDYVEWLNSQLPKTSKLNLLGHSNGGRISAAFAIKYPDRVDKLILIDSAGLVDQRFKTKLKRFIFKTLAKIGKIILPFETTRTGLYKLTREKDYLETPESLRQTMQNLISVDLRTKLNKIRAKTLIIWGEADKVTPVADAKIFNSKIKFSKLVLINQARHSPMFTHPRKVAKVVEEFIK